MTQHTPSQIAAVISSDHGRGADSGHSLQLVGHGDVGVTNGHSIVSEPEVLNPDILPQNLPSKVAPSAVRRDTS